MNPLDELNEDIEHTRKLITMHTRNLKKSEERAANYGSLDLPLALSNEIDNIKEKIEDLQLELTRLEKEKVIEAAPLIYLHCFGRLEERPAGAKLLDWSAEFNREVTPRQIPDPQIWEQRLWPQLKALRDDRDIPPGLIRLRGTAALSAGFAFGLTFPRAQYQIEMAQRSDLWYSDAGETQAGPEFAVGEHDGAAQAGPVGVVVNALTGASSADLLAAVTGYMEPQGGLKKILLLEAETPVHQKEHLQGDEAAVLARTSQPILRNFVTKTGSPPVHLFLATPVGLAVFLGHNWNAIGAHVQCYEYSGLTGQYTPSCARTLN